MQRRDFLAQSAVGAALATGAGARIAAAQSGGIKKAVVYSMLPGSLPPLERFKLARECGFDGVEMPPVPEAECDALRTAAESAGVRLHSVIFGGWNPPLTHPDPAQREKAVQLTEAGLRSAKRLGADCILLVPGVVNAQTPYRSAYRWATEGVRKVLPTAEKLKIQILIEEVWNNFLLSPMEFNAFIDGFRSEWVQAYFDVGNVVPFAWPEDWIRTLGKRIKRVHLKDFKGGPGLFEAIKGSFVNLREGSINWPEVRKAFREVGYEGWLTCELRGGDAEYLKDVNRRVDQIIAGQ